MATLVGVFNMSHSPFCYMPPEKWNDVRACRSLRADVPVDDVEANRAKAARDRAAFAALRARLAAAAPDVLVVFGDDQLECFDFTNFPTFAVYVGETFEGALVERRHREAVPGHPALGRGPAHRPDAARLRPRLLPGHARSPSAASATPSCARPNR